MSDVIEDLRFAAEHGFGASLCVANVRDVLARHDEAEQRGYERGLREGREAERADVVAWLGGPAIDLANPAMRDCMEELCGMVASPIARAEHVPTPQGDEEVNHG